MKVLHLVSVEKPYVAVGCSTSRGEEASLVRTPADSFHRCGVLPELMLALAAVKRCDEKLVVVASGSELLPVKGPLQTANLLSVTAELTDVALARTQVSMKDGAVAGPCRQYVFVPSDRAHPTQMPVVVNQPAALVDIPNLRDTLVGSDSDQRPSCVPIHRGDSVIIAYLCQFLDCSSLR